LTDAGDFLRGGGSRALGFFSDVDSVEHSVFLTVAQELLRRPEDLQPRFGRANIGRGTSGCAFYVTAAVPFTLPNGTHIPSPLLVKRFWLPPSANDSSTAGEWEQRVQTERAAPSADAPPLPQPLSPPPSPAPLAMWEALLEAEVGTWARFD